MVLGVVVVSSATAPIASVGWPSKTETKLWPLLVLTHKPPDAAPATINPVASAATEVIRPVIAVLLPITVPVKLLSSDIGCGPSRFHVDVTAGLDVPKAALAMAPRFAVAMARILAIALGIACLGTPYCSPRREAK